MLCTKKEEFDCVCASSKKDLQAKGLHPKKGYVTLIYSFTGDVSVLGKQLKTTTGSKNLLKKSLDYEGLKKKKNQHYADQIWGKKRSNLVKCLQIWLRKSSVCQVRHSN